jgi:hypothetical protein
MLRVSVYSGWVIATLAMGVSTMAEAQFITRWVNANGVVTFSTSSPPPGVKYEPIHMPQRSSKRPTDPVPEADSGEAIAAATGDDGKNAEAPASTGPAQVTVQEQATTSLGETQWLLLGKVKNEGGTVADGVAISINVLEDGQGNPCLEDRGTVSPSTLKPGETGTFELAYDSPCFFGSPQIDIVAEWQK